MGWIRNKLILWNFCSKLDSFNLICQAPCQICPIWYTGIFEMGEAYAGEFWTTWHYQLRWLPEILVREGVFAISDPKRCTNSLTCRETNFGENHCMFDRKFLEGLVFKIKISGLGQNRPRDDASIMKLKWRSC